MFPPHPAYPTAGRGEKIGLIYSAEMLLLKKDKNKKVKEAFLCALCSEEYLSFTSSAVKISLAGKVGTEGKADGRVEFFVL